VPQVTQWQTAASLLSMNVGEAFGPLKQRLPRSSLGLLACILRLPSFHSLRVSRLVGGLPFNTGARVSLQRRQGVLFALASSYSVCMRLCPLPQFAISGRVRLWKGSVCGKHPTHSSIPTCRWVARFGNTACIGCHASNGWHMPHNTSLNPTRYIGASRLVDRRLALRSAS
jgi:hypothetical protein